MAGRYKQFHQVTSLHHVQQPAGVQDSCLVQAHPHPLRSTERHLRGQQLLEHVQIHPSHLSGAHAVPNHEYIPRINTEINGTGTCPIHCNTLVSSGWYIA